MEAYENLIQRRINTDNSLAKTRSWPPSDTVLGSSLASFESTLGAHRASVRNLSMTITYNIEFYTNITHAFMDWADNSVILPEKGQLWSLLVTVSAMLRISDAIGIQRALGATFFTLCGFTDNNMNYFIGLEGQTKSLFELAFNYHPMTLERYQQRFLGSELDTEIAWKKSLIISTTYPTLCLDIEEEIRFQKSLAWFSNLTSYIVLLKVSFKTAETPQP